MNKSKIFDQTAHPKEINDFYHIFNLPNILNVIYWDKFYQLIDSVEGDIVECGIGRGRSLITILALNILYSNLRNKLMRTVVALDSFEGFPEPSHFDRSSRDPKKGEWSESPNKQFKYSEKNLLKILEYAGVIDSLEYAVKEDGSRKSSLRIIKGYFDKTTLNLNVSKIALLHLDGDLYHSVRDPLDNLANKISIGGIVVIDDFIYNKSNECEDSFPGARIAINEFLVNNRNFEIRESIRGTPYLIKLY